MTEGLFAVIQHQEIHFTVVKIVIFRGDCGRCILREDLCITSFHLSVYVSACHRFCHKLFYEVFLCHRVHKLMLKTKCNSVERLIMDQVC